MTSPVSGIRTPELPLLPLWEKGAGGDEGQKRSGMQKISDLSQEIYPGEEGFTPTARGAYRTYAQSS